MMNVMMVLGSAASKALTWGNMLAYRVMYLMVGLGFFQTAVDGLKTVVTAIGAGIAVWGVINLLEGYGNDNPGAKSQGIKQLMAGGGVVIIAQTVIPQMSTLF